MTLSGTKQPCGMRCCASRQEKRANPAAVVSIVVPISGGHSVSEKGNSLLSPGASPAALCKEAANGPKPIWDRALTAHRAVGTVASLAQEHSPYSPGEHDDQG